MRGGHGGQQPSYVWLTHGTEPPKELMETSNARRMRISRQKQKQKEKEAEAYLVMLEAQLLTLRVRTERLERAFEKKRGFGASGGPKRFPPDWSTAPRAPLKPSIVHITGCHPWFAHR
jgi:hypothetical protein